MDALVMQDILELLANAGHSVLAMEREDHHESGVEDDPLHDQIVADEII